MIKQCSRFLFAFWFFGCFLFCVKANAQKAFRLDSVRDEVILNRDWKIHRGDNKEWANPAFDDKDWDSISKNFGNVSKDSSKTMFIISTNNGIVWLRLHLKVAPSLWHKTLLLQVEQKGASELYLNNTLIESFGKIGNTETEIPYDPGDNVYHIQLGGDTMQVLAVRYSQNAMLKGQDPNHSIATALNITLANLSKVNELILHDELQKQFCIIVSAVFLTLSLFHLLLFVYYRKTRSNLYYSIFAALMATISLSFYLIIKSHNPVWVITLAKVDSILVALCFFLILVLLYSIFEKKINWLFWTLIGLTLLSIITSVINLTVISSILVFTQACTASFSGIVIIIKALKKKQKGVWIIASGFLVFLGLLPSLLILTAINSIFKRNVNGLLPDEIMFFMWIFSIPASMSAYLASDFGRTNKKLLLQLVHVKQLSEQNIEKEREKQQIIKQQKEMLEVQVKEKTSEIQDQKNELLQKNTEIIDSILYARRIQNAILPSDEMLKEALGDYLVIFKPKDVVSGDFYWCHVNGDFVVFAVADCTGHGVPGALMSMIGNSLLNEVVMDGKTLEADLILNELRSKLIITLQQQSGGHTTQDGMDIALCVWNKKDNTLQYAGANNPLYRISENIMVDTTIQQSGKLKLHNGHLMEIVGDKQPVGYQEGKMDTVFTKHVIQLHKGDTIYITSDGYIDQFGGVKNKKFTSKRLRDLLSTFNSRSIDSQRMSLVQTIEDWKKYEIQTDDICVFGVRI